MTDEVAESISEIKPTDLRGILKYVPMFQNQTFVISVDGRIVEDPLFNSLLLDIAVLRNLHIKVILVFGIGQPLRQLAESSGETVTDVHGTGPVDDTTLKLGTKAAGTRLPQHHARAHQDGHQMRHHQRGKSDAGRIIKGKDPTSLGESRPGRYRVA